MSIQVSINVKKILLVLNRKYRSLRDYIVAMRVPNAISSLLSEQLYARKHVILGERAKGESECPLLPLPVDARDEDWRRSEQSPENTVCSCKQMAGNYLQFAIYTSVLPFSPIDSPSLVFVAVFGAELPSRGDTSIAG